MSSSVSDIKIYLRKIKDELATQNAQEELKKISKTKFNTKEYNE